MPGVTQHKVAELRLGLGPGRPWHHDGSSRLQLPTGLHRALMRATGTQPALGTQAMFGPGPGPVPQLFLHSLAALMPDYGLDQGFGDELSGSLTRRSSLRHRLHGEHEIHIL